MIMDPLRRLRVWLVSLSPRHRQSISLVGALFLALVVQQVAVPRRRPRKFGSAVGATRFCRLP